MAESLQHKLDRVRSPRVQITYDVEIGGAILKKELPFVMGILADLSGTPKDPLPKLRERKFVEIDRDNLSDIMKTLSPRLALRMEPADGKEPWSVELFFHCMEDFAPLSLVKQIPGLCSLYQTRTHLKDLLTKLDGNDELALLLNTMMTDETVRKAIETELGTGEGSQSTPPPPSS